MGDSPKFRDSVDAPPTHWLAWIGPGAIIASLTIGAGELVFSSTAGALFGYRVLWFFSLILLAKWILVITTARSFILTGIHPLQRWVELPGPRGWLPWTFLILAVLCFPIWVGFHAGTLGSLVAWLTNSGNKLHGGAHFAWGMLILAATLALALRGGYKTLERVQMAIVGIMLLCVTAALLIIRPDWMAMLSGFLLPGKLSYPGWIQKYPEIAARPVWVEVITYVGVLGGSGYDYLAYVSYLRDKGWGRAGMVPLSRQEMESAGAAANDRAKAWLQVLWVDATVSFLAVLFFSAVFVACGTVILGQQQKVPAGSNLLSLQSEFVAAIHPLLKPVYFVGAFLTMLGTLYGTIEVAPAILRELRVCLFPKAAPEAERWRRMAIWWVSAGGLAVLIFSLVWTMTSDGKSPPGLVQILTPANLFTGVLACGFICLLNAWIERTGLAEFARCHPLLRIGAQIAGICFLLLGIKAYADQGGWKAVALVLGTPAVGLIAAKMQSSSRRS